MKNFYFEFNETLLKCIGVGISQDKSKVDIKKGKIPTINKKQELTESFICIWREERCLWDVKLPSYM